MNSEEKYNIENNKTSQKEFTLDYFDTFSSKEELVAKWVGFFKSIGLVTGDETNWKKFIEENTYNLYLEAQYYKLNRDNPFFIFLNKFTNDNHDVSILTNLYKAIHNMVAEGFISVKQLAFMCSNDQLIRILLNKYLYNNSQNDFIYLIRIYNWLLRKNTISQIKNKYVLRALNDIDDKNMTLIKVVYFTNAIQLFMKSSKSEQDFSILYRAFKLNIADAALMSTPLRTCDEIEEAMKYLDESTDENDRDIYDGRYKKLDVSKENSINKLSTSSDFLTQAQKNAYKSKINEKIKTLQAELGVKNITQLINAISDIYN